MSTQRTTSPYRWEPEQFEQRPPVDWGKVTDRLTSWALIIGVMGSMALVGFIAGLRWDDSPVTIAPPASIVETIDETSPQWNCLTMGNHLCGPEWTSVETATLDDGSPMMDVLTEGERTDWTGCLTNSGPTVTIVCPDGYVEVWS
jgi:hypothetical protein